MKNRGKSVGFYHPVALPETFSHLKMDGWKLEDDQRSFQGRTRAVFFKGVYTPED